MSPETYNDLREHVVRLGYGADIFWAEEVGPPPNARFFASEAIFVICNSGMKATVARGIFERVMLALTAGHSAATAFGHRAKAAAIDDIWGNRREYFQEYSALESVDQLDWLGCLPWIGPITKYHLGRNFGLNVVKPDRHLQRIAEAEGSTPHALCRQLAQATGDRIGTVDYVLWRAAERGLIQTRELATVATE